MFRHLRLHTPHRRLQEIREILPLSNFPSGLSGIVVEINGGNAFLSRMISLGLSPGIEVGVLQNHLRGPVLICVRDSRLALGRKEAQEIFLRVIHGDSDNQQHP